MLWQPERHWHLCGKGGRKGRNKGRREKGREERKGGRERGRKKEGWMRGGKGVAMTNKQLCMYTSTANKLKQENKNHCHVHRQTKFQENPTIFCMANETKQAPEREGEGTSLKRSVLWLNSLYSTAWSSNTCFSLDLCACLDKHYYGVNAAGTLLTKSKNPYWVLKIWCCTPNSLLSTCIVFIKPAWCLPGRHLIWQTFWKQSYQIFGKTLKIA